MAKHKTAKSIAVLKDKKPNKKTTKGVKYKAERQPHVSLKRALGDKLSMYFPAETWGKSYDEAFGVGTSVKDTTDTTATPGADVAQRAPSSGDLRRRSRSTSK
ncbi:hypothetical protein BD414DRAFT_508111 [Trametes punicea]|nr:hypothetical protein BD414DRAFT_508111 [Trametes punicea]